MQYILNLRITNAKSLLRTTTYSIADVAAIVGYENPLYFSRLFKNRLGFHLQNFGIIMKRKCLVLGTAQN